MATRHRLLTKSTKLEQLGIFEEAKKPSPDKHQNQLAWEIGERVGKRIVNAGFNSIHKLFSDFIHERVSFLKSKLRRGKPYTRDEIMERVSKEVDKKIEQLSQIQDKLTTLKLGAIKDNIELVLKQDVPYLREKAEKENKHPTEFSLIIRALEARIKNEEKRIEKEFQRELF